MIKDIFNRWGLFRKDTPKPEPSLAALIQEELIKLNSQIVLNTQSWVKEKNRYSQFNLHGEGRVYVDLWENGMCWYSRIYNDISQAARVLYLWNDVRANSNEIEQAMPGTVFPEERKMIEAGNEAYLAWRWQNYLAGDHLKDSEAELIALLSQDEVTRRLMPFSQLWDIGLSRYIGDHGDDIKNDLLRARVVKDGFVVCTEDQADFSKNPGLKEYLGKGNAQQAFTIIKNNLPDDLGWAHYQTLEQYMATTKDVLQPRTQLP